MKGDCIATLSDGDFDSSGEKQGLSGLWPDVVSCHGGLSRLKNYKYRHPQSSSRPILDLLRQIALFDAIKNPPYFNNFHFFAFGIGLASRLR